MKPRPTPCVAGRPAASPLRGRDNTFMRLGDAKAVIGYVVDALKEGTAAIH